MDFFHIIITKLALYFPRVGEWVTRHIFGTRGAHSWIHWSPAINTEYHCGDTDYATRLKSGLRNTVDFQGTYFAVIKCQYLSYMSQDSIWKTVFVDWVSSNIRPVIIKNCSILKFWVFPWDVENQWSVTRCYLKSPPLCSREKQSYPGATWASIEDDHIKRPYPSLYHEVK